MSMSKAVTDKTACAACGADVRSEALFCYSCGGDLGGASPTDRPAEVVGGSAKTGKTPESNNAAAQSNSDLSDAKSKEKAKPLSAAMLRRKRAFNRQPVEVVWNVPESHSMTFLIASIALTILVGIILAAAFYLK